eukprot:gnl/Chilomastix_cuspidata/5888.p2 GENE.gnl/Chilomastix_cuspidata/5888~~gnl/Chilomastix_cuspidata/5888.p2  ORF type:complete len:154 (+),score=4.44 gnl/Chilomastix_cuspidata/5888:116-577(+)
MEWKPRERGPEARSGPGSIHTLRFAPVAGLRRRLVEGLRRAKERLNMVWQKEGRIDRISFGGALSPHTPRRWRGPALPEPGAGLRGRAPSEFHSSESRPFRTECAHACLPCRAALAPAPREACRIASAPRRLPLAHEALAGAQYLSGAVSANH